MTRFHDRVPARMGKVNVPPRFSSGQVEPVKFASFRINRETIIVIVVIVKLCRPKIQRIFFKTRTNCISD